METPTPDLFLSETFCHRCRGCKTLRCRAPGVGDEAAVPISRVPWALWDYGDSDRQCRAAECARASPVIGSARGPVMLWKDKTADTDKLVSV